MSALQTQEGGDHYRHMPIQPVEFIHRNNLDYFQGNVIKYVCRHKRKGTGLADLRKAIHYIELMIHFHYAEEGQAGELLQ